MALSSKIPTLGITSLIVLISAAGVAQRMSGVVGMFSTGVSSIHEVSSSKRMEIADSIRFRRIYTHVGVEGYYRHGKGIISISGHLGVQQAKRNGEKFLEPYSWTAHTAFGWLLSGNTKLSIYPAVGIGMSGSSITEHTPRIDTHIEIARATTPSADLSLHCDYLLVDPGATGIIVNGIALGTKVGYNFSVSKAGQLRGWYFTISVGGLAFMRKNI